VTDLFTNGNAINGNAVGSVSVIDIDNKVISTVPLQDNAFGVGIGKWQGMDVLPT
jgi:hypothetical protein